MKALTTFLFAFAFVVIVALVVLSAAYPQLTVAVIFTIAAAFIASGFRKDR